ncbi:er lumen protein-retaining receptor a [Quercus suber]|uniref:ER lumen protein-retaining receptor n=1 Tax=Quercus suber TaxID=58331 RepID=A0AAW0KLE8_QUESU
MNIFRFAGDMTHLISILVLLLKIYATKSCSGISRKTQELYALVFLARYVDIFTEFISVYNTIMKIVFIASSLAIVWCMRGHRVVRRSYDRELDTFRHYFLIAASLVLALLVHEKFTFQEILWAFSIYLEAVAILPQLVLLQRSGNVDNLTGQYVFFLGAYRGLYILNWIYRYFTEAHFSRWIGNLCLESLRTIILWAFSIYLEAVAILPQLVLLQRSGNVDNLTGQYVFFLGAYRGLYILNWIYRYFTEAHFSRWIACVSGLVQTALYADFFYYYFLSWKNNAKLKLPA